METIKRNLLSVINKDKNTKGRVYVAQQQALFHQIGNLNEAMRLMSELAKEINYGK